MTTTPSSQALASGLASALARVARARALARTWRHAADTGGQDRLAHPGNVAAGNWLRHAAEQLDAALDDDTPAPYAAINAMVTPAHVDAVLDELAPRRQLPPGITTSEGPAIRVPAFLIDHGGVPVYPDLADVRHLAERIAAAVLNIDTRPLPGSAGYTDADSGGATYDLATGQAVSGLPPPTTDRTTASRGPGEWT